MRGVGGRTLLTADQLEIKTLSPYNRGGGGVRAKEKGIHKANGGRSKLKRILGRGGNTCKGLRPALKTFSTGLILLVQIQQCDKVLKPDLKKV